jgi:hypothetical protein
VNRNHRLKIMHVFSNFRCLTQFQVPIAVNMKLVSFFFCVLCLQCIRNVLTKGNGSQCEKTWPTVHDLGCTFCSLENSEERKMKWNNRLMNRKVILVFTAVVYIMQNCRFMVSFKVWFQNLLNSLRKRIKNLTALVTRFIYTV